MLDKKELLNTIDNLRKEHHVPSIQVGIVKDGEVIFKDAVGYRDYENKIEADTKTIYAIGSATKAFTAASIASLVDEGKLQWDKPIKSYIPEFKMYDSYVSENLTVRDILCHRCGLPRHDTAWCLNQNSLSRDDLIHNLRYLEPSAPFRYQMQYQNLMFVLAGYLIERVSGYKWDKFINERLVSPLQMKDTNFSVEDTKSIDNKALPYKFNGEEIKRIPFKNIDIIGSAGAINSNIEDMLNWVKFNLAKGEWKGKTIVSKDNIKECHTPQMINNGKLRARSFEEARFCSYGLGWSIESYKGHEVIHHGGGIDGFIAMVSFIPEINAGFVILTNGDINKTASIIQNTLYDILLDCDRTDWNSRYKSEDDNQKSELKERLNKIHTLAPKNTKPSLQLENYVGDYENDAYGKISISINEDGLILQASGLSITFEHLCFDTFLSAAKEQLLYESLQLTSMQFNIDITGKVTGADIDLEPELGKMIKFSRL